MANMKFYLFSASAIVFLPVIASAQSIQTLLPNIVTFINTVLIPFLFGLAFLIFAYNAVLYFIIGGSNEDGRENAKNLAIYSVAAFVFLIIFWGIVNILSTSVGLEGEKQLCPDYMKVKGKCP